MSKDKFGNSRKASHLGELPEWGLESKDDTLTKRCKFNFSYFCKQPGVGKHFGDLSKAELNDLFEKILGFCQESLLYWQKQKHGVSATLRIYKNFPTDSDFSHPKHVPHDVHWGRFRMSGDVRLAGFVVPAELHGTMHNTTNVAFDCNTFYAVFIDDAHRFYKSKKK